MRHLPHNLPYPDFFHLEACSGWIELGNASEAEQELQRIIPEHLNSVPVLVSRWQICALRKDWQGALELSNQCCTIAPDYDFGWIHYSYALHELQRTQEAWDFLAAVARKFPKNPVIPYNLACYACRLGRSKVAWRYLKRAAQIGDKNGLRKQALGDPDLLPLRHEIMKW